MLVFCLGSVNVCFLLNDLQLSGGITVVLEHARRLVSSHGMDVTLVQTSHADEVWAYPHLAELELITLRDAKKQSFDVAVATWWETVYELPQIEARYKAYFVQSLEHRFYQQRPVDRMLAAITHELPLSFVTEARWIQQVLADLQPDAPCFYVRNGIAKETFVPPAEPSETVGEPLRILVEGNPHVWYKAVPDAAAAIGAMAAQHHATLVTPWPVDTDVGFDDIVGPLSHAEMASAYAETDVVLKLSRVEGMSAPPLEGFHLGATAVVSPVTGHDEYIVHGWNGVVTGWDDVAGTARWLDLLATDRSFLSFLRRNALATARAWPSWDEAADEMAEALNAIVTSPEASTDTSWHRFSRDLWTGSAEIRRTLGGLGWELEGSMAKLERVEWELGNAEMQLARQRAEFDTRAVRLAIALRTLKTKLQLALAASFRALRGHPRGRVRRAQHSPNPICCSDPDKKALANDFSDCEFPDGAAARSTDTGRT